MRCIIRIIVLSPPWFDIIEMLLEEAACAQTTAQRETSVTLVVLNTAMASELVDIVPLKTFLDGVNDYEREPPSLYVDLEGNNLSRNGTLSLVTTLIARREKVYLIDVTTPGRDAFNTAGPDWRTLQDILESSKIVEVFFDIRNDSNVLFSLYGVHVR